MDSKLPPKSATKLNRDRSRSPRAIAAALATVTIVGIGLSLSMTLLAVRLAEQGFSASAIGVNAAAGGLATLATAPFVPDLARRFGVKRLLVVALIGSAASLAALAASTGYWTWLATRSLLSAALTILFTVSEFWIGSAAPAARRGMILGLYTASFALGVAVGPSILTLTGTQGASPFLAAIVLFLIASLPIALLGARAPIIEPQARTSVFAFAAAMPTAMLAALLYGAIETGAMGFLPVYALRSGLGAATGAVLVTIFALGNGVFQTPVGLISDWFDRRHLLVLIAGAGAVGALLLPLAREAEFAAFAALLFIWGGVVGSLYAVGLAYLGSRYKGAELASGNAAYIMFYSTGMLVGPPLIGLGLDLAPAGLFVALALMLAAYFVLAATS
jgi:MFS family permease